MYMYIHVGWPFPKIADAKMAAVACTRAFSSQPDSWHTVGRTKGNKIAMVPNACTEIDGKRGEGGREGGREGERERGREGERERHTLKYCLYRVTHFTQYSQILWQKRWAFQGLWLGLVCRRQAHLHWPTPVLCSCWSECPVHSNTNF